MKHCIGLAVLSIAVLLLCSPARANSFRIGPSVGMRGSATPIGVALGLQFQKNVWLDLQYSYMVYHDNDINVISPGFSYRDAINDKWEWFVGGGLAVMPTQLASKGPGRPAVSTTPVGGGANFGASWRISDKMLTSAYLEYAYAGNDDVNISYFGLGLRLDFELGKK
jgi:hypothetical protein